MDEITRRRAMLKARLRDVCNSVLSSIDSRVRIALSFGAKDVTYKFDDVNVTGCPVLSPKRSCKVRRYVTKKLRNQGFAVRDIRDEGKGWIIHVTWSRGANDEKKNSVVA